jgi:hypothetical protein
MWRRGHVAQDILPYVCVYEDCESPDEMYLTSDEFLKHVRDQHGVVHWVCDYCASKSEAYHPYIFKSIEDWEYHIEKKHNAAFLPSQLPSLANVSQQRMVEPLACPLCGDAAEHPQLNLDNHIVQHMHEFSLRCLPWGTGGNEKDSVDAKSADAPNLSELIDEDNEDVRSVYLDIVGVDKPSQLYEAFKTTTFRLLGKLHPEYHHIWPYDKQVREQILSAEERLFECLSVAEPLAEYQAHQLVQQQADSLALVGLFASSGFMSQHEQIRLSGKLRSYSFDPSLNFPKPENKLLEDLKSHLLKVICILNQIVLRWNAKQPSNAFELYCEKTRPILRERIKDDSVNTNFEEKLTRDWKNLSDSERGQFQKKSEVEVENYKEYETQTAQDTKTMLEDELDALDAALLGWPQEILFEEVKSNAVNMGNQFTNPIFNAPVHISKHFHTLTFWVK